MSEPIRSQWIDARKLAHKQQCLCLRAYVIVDGPVCAIGREGSFKPYESSVNLA